MELFILCGLIFFTLFVSVSLSYLVFQKTINKSSSTITANTNNLPPGNMGLPYIGESLQFLNTGRKGHPEKFIFDRVAKYSSNVFKTSILAEHTVVVCGATANKFLFSNENKLVNVWWPNSVNKIFSSTTQTSSSKEESKKLRKMLPNFLKPEALMRYIGMMDSIAQQHFQSGWENKEQVTVFPLVKRYTFWVACKVFLSIQDPKHVAKFADPFNDVASGIISIPINLPGTSFNKGIKASNQIRKELLAIIEQRKIDLANKPTHDDNHDILSHMLVATDDNGQHMTDLDIADKILEQMEIAKSKKPGELLNWDDIQKMKYSWNVACEVMRLAPPVQGAFREAINDFVFSGFSIPKGWKLYWSTHSTHRNPECFPEPEKFDPTRFEGTGPVPYTFVPFGGGPRMCPGKEYARLVILVFMHNVIKRFNWEKLLADEKIIVDPIPIPAKGLPVRLIPHKA
ncbi:hypothetical protein EZV62_006568 [Acer yangbiense]|uniref:Cytochrome P450 n=1 Tax=Acer yangbiense TaxID=1000413 RepID=A0A5C7I6W1_9ROSI|nr:hypothetical protein EZV62_006568 [Acer yangbiense]